MAEYNSTSNHAEQIASGEIVPAYGAARLDPKDPHDAALIEAGTFVAQQAEQPARAKKGDE